MSAPMTTATVNEFKNVSPADGYRHAISRSARPPQSQCSLRLPTIHGLVFATFRSNVPTAMSRLSARQILNLILAVLVTAGLSGSVAWAGEAPAKVPVAMGMDMGMVAHKHCHGCPGGDDSAKMIVCGVMCSLPILAVAPQIAPMSQVQVGALFALPQPPLHGRTPPPEPYPPKPSRIV
jgi:hypothetical protein